MHKACVKALSGKIGFLGAEIKKNFNFGKMSDFQSGAIVLVLSLVFSGYVFLIQRYYYNELVQKIPPTKTFEELRQENLESRIKELVKGTPIEIMAPYIAKKDKKTAAFMVGIARKESNWGKRRPVLDGKDCYNYWGYRGISDTMGSGGHTCFGSPQEAVTVVSKRVAQIIRRNEAESAKNMIVWKCGYSCDAHSSESVSKWISDVDLYAGKILN